MIAVLPCAGLGTRMNEITRGRSKELLRLGRSTVLERVIDEALEAEPDAIVIVGAPDKPDLDAFVAARPDLEIVHQVPRRGFGHAIACGCRDDDAIVLLGDTALAGGSPVARMANLLAIGIDGCVAVQQVSEDVVHRYGIVEVDEGTGAIRRVIEKPRPEDTPSRWAISARYGLSRGLVAMLQGFVAEQLVARDTEVGMTEFLNAAILAGADLKAVALPPGARRIDCGSPEEYSRAIHEPDLA